MKITWRHRFRKHNTLGHPSSIEKTWWHRFRVFFMSHLKKSLNNSYKPFYIRQYRKSNYTGSQVTFTFKVSNMPCDYS
jgi:hypothetical protein